MHGFCAWSLLLLLFPFKAFFQKGEAFDEGLSRAGGIEAEEAVSFRSEDVSHVEPEVAVIDDFVLEVFVGKAVSGSVDPEEVGALEGAVQMMAFWAASLLMVANVVWVNPG